METLLYEEQNSFTLEKNTTMYNSEDVTLSLNEEWKTGCKKEPEFDVSCLLRSPDMVIPSLEFEHFFIRGIENSSKSNTTEVIAEGYGTSQVTEEQESFVRGFTDALQKLYHEEKQNCIPLDSNSNIASVKATQEESSKCTFVNYHFHSSERLPSFAEAFSSLKAPSVPSSCSSTTEDTFTQAMERFEAGRTNILNWDSDNPKATINNQDNSLELVVFDNDKQRHQLEILDNHEGHSFNKLPLNDVDSCQEKTQSSVSEIDAIPLSFENATMNLESAQVELDYIHQTEAVCGAGISPKQSVVYTPSTRCENEAAPQTENILESLSSFYDNDSDYSISSPATSEYSNYETQHLWEEQEDDEYKEGATGGELTPHELQQLGVEPSFEEALSLGMPDDVPANKHWLSVHTKLYGMNTYAQKSEFSNRTLENSSEHHASLSPMDFTVQDFVKTQRKRRKNRLAAWKCRQKKLIRESCLETKVEELCYQNGKLLEELERLKKKRRALEESFVKHASSGCQEAQEQYHQHAFNPIST